MVANVATVGMARPLPTGALATDDRHSKAATAYVFTFADWSGDSSQPPTLTLDTAPDLTATGQVQYELNVLLLRGTTCAQQRHLRLRECRDVNSHGRYRFHLHRVERRCRYHYQPHHYHDGQRQIYHRYLWPESI